MKENKDITYQNLWDEAKAMLRGIFIAINACMKKEEISNISNQQSKVIPENSGKRRSN